MAGRIPDATLQTIRDRISLVEVVSRYVTLKKAGHNHVGLCPFHSEKTASFTVREDQGLFYCFGCGAGGTVFTFLMRIERLEFPEAVAELAKRAGVTIEERGSGGVGAERRERLLRVNEQAARFFSEELRSSAGGSAERYLSGRGLNADTVKRFELGFAPAGGRALTSWLRGRGVALGAAVEAGVLGRSDDGRVYDRFRGRVMFPIRDRRERVVGFGARALGDEQPKYLNSPETPIFRKGDVLYGLPEARPAIRRAERVVLVEGYLDALSLVQAGIEETVATLGTAVTVNHLRVLRRFAGTVVAFFDGDVAGRKAASRSFALCAEAGVWGRCAVLPEGSDPDSYARERGRDAILELLEEARPLADVYFDSVAPPAGAPLPARARVAGDVARTLARVSDPFEFDLLVRRAAEHLGLSEELLRRPRRESQRTSDQAARQSEPQWPAAERMLVEAIATDRDVALWVAEQQALTYFVDPMLAGAAQRLIEAWEGGRDPAAVIDTLPPSLGERLTAMLFENGPAVHSDPRRIAEDCVARLTRQSEQRARRTIATKLRDAENSGDEARFRAALADLNELLPREGGGA